MKLSSLVGLLLGLSVLAFLIVWQQAGEVTQAIQKVGWGVLLVCLFAVPSLALGAEGWRRLAPPGIKPSFGRVGLAWCVGYSVNTLLPVASIGGEAAKIALAKTWGRPVQEVLSTIVVDRAMQAVAMLFWGLAGITMLAALAPDKAVVIPTALASVVLAMGIGAFMAIQIKGGFAFLAKYSGKLIKEEKRDAWKGRAADLDQAIRAIYRRRGALAISSTLHLAEKAVLAGEVMLVSHLLGQPLSLGEAVMVRGIVDALRLVAFFIPAGLGVQEGALIVLGTVVGVSSPTMLTLSLVTRVREILPSIPFFIYFQVVQARLLRRSAAQAD